MELVATFTISYAVTPGLKIRLTGDASLRKRNMSRLIDILSQFGADFIKK